MKSGFLLIDKEKGISSFGVIAKIRKIFGIKKVGHAGTLDPLASGLMLVGIGQATRFLEFHVGHSKEYIATIKLGEISETFDAEGPITKKDLTKKYTKKEIETNLKFFRGKIWQTPPKYSALKINGKKLCNLVREGKEVDVSVKKREIEIFENEIIEYKWPVLKLRIKCSSGTYIRSIANDLGKKLSCGGYLSGLQRTKIDDLDIKDAKKVEAISEQDLLDMDIGLKFEKIELNMDIIKRLRHGQRVNIKPIGDYKDGIYRIYSKNTFFGISEVFNDILKAKKIIP